MPRLKKVFVTVLIVSCFCAIQCRRREHRRKHQSYAINQNAESRSELAALTSTFNDEDGNSRTVEGRPRFGQREVENLPEWLQDTQVSVIIKRSSPKQEISKVAGSAPTALDSRYNSPAKDTGSDQVSRQAVDPIYSPNPQKPTGWNTGANDQIDKSTGWNLASSHFNHPGHFQTTNNYQMNLDVSNYPHEINLHKYPNAAYPNTGSYNYYGVGNSYNYGNGYQYNPKQPFEGYHLTPNIGVIPPKNVNAVNYYNSIMGFVNMPIFAQHSNQGGLFGRLFGGQKHGAYAYGYGAYASGSSFGNNAYKNVLAGLLIWNLMHGLTNYRYNVYNYYNHPELVPRNLSVPAENVIVCPKNATMLCSTSTTALCTTNNTIFCVTTAVSAVRCNNSLTSLCVNITEPCPKASNTPCNASGVNLPCVSNVTIFGKINSASSDTFGNLFDQETNETVLCVTTFAIPQAGNEKVTDPCATNSKPEATLNENLPCLLNYAPAIKTGIASSTSGNIGLNESEATTIASK